MVGASQGTLYFAGTEAGTWPRAVRRRCLRLPWDEPILPVISAAIFVCTRKWGPNVEHCGLTCHRTSKAGESKDSFQSGIYLNSRTLLPFCFLGKFRLEFLEVIYSHWGIIFA